MRFTQALDDAQLFASRFGPTFNAHRTIAKAMAGDPMTKAERALYERCTGRSKAPSEPFQEVCIIAGRRSGKGRFASAVATYRAAFVDHGAYLAPGERAVVMCLASDKQQARVAFKYIRGLLEIPMLAPLVENETRQTIDLTTRASVEVFTSNHKAVRGVTIACAILDEVAFWPNDEDAANADVETDAALTPALATSPGSLKLITSTPYAKRGLLWETYSKHYGRDDSPVLVWQAPSLLMNPTLSPAVVEAALDRDESRARAEWLGLFREDVEGFLGRDVINACVLDGCREIPPTGGAQYVGFVDPSGGSRDSFTAAVAHLDEDGRAILDATREIRPPFNPEAATAELCDFLRRYHISRVRGDAYAAEWVASTFAKNGITYERSDMTRSELYLELLPLVNARQVQLLDDDRLVSQLANLERRRGRSGRDSVDHAPGSHDDCANAVAGAIVHAHLQPRFTGLAAPIMLGGGRNLYALH